MIELFRARTIHGMNYSSTESFLDWTNSWLNHSLIDLLLDWTIPWLVFFFTDLLLDWCIPWLNYCLTEVFLHWSISEGKSFPWLNFSSTELFFAWILPLRNDSLTDWTIPLQNCSLIELFLNWSIDRFHEWTISLKLHRWEFCSKLPLISGRASVLLFGLAVLLFGLAVLPLTQIHNIRIWHRCGFIMLKPVSSTHLCQVHKHISQEEPSQKNVCGQSTTGFMHTCWHQATSSTKPQGRSFSSSWKIWHAQVSLKLRQNGRLSKPWCYMIEIHFYGRTSTSYSYAQPPDSLQHLWQSTWQHRSFRMEHEWAPWSDKGKTLTLGLLASDSFSTL